MNSNQKQTYCLRGRHYSNTNKITEFEKKTLRIKNLLKLSKIVVVFVDGVKVKFLQCKRLVQKILIIMQNASTVIDQL